jgi:hypothetical protein
LRRECLATRLEIGGCDPATLEQSVGDERLVLEVEKE